MWVISDITDISLSVLTSHWEPVPVASVVHSSLDPEIAPWWFCMISWESFWTKEDLMWRWKYDKYIQPIEGGRFIRGDLSEIDHGTFKVDLWKRRFLLETRDLGYPLVKLKVGLFVASFAAGICFASEAVFVPYRKATCWGQRSWNLEGSQTRHRQWWWLGLDLLCELIRGYIEVAVIVIIRWVMETR